MKIDKTYYVYITTNITNNVLYIGITNNLQRRIYEHKNGSVEGFSKKYKVNKLVYYETTNDVNSAIAREKGIKKWRREKKNNLIKSVNLNLNDLSDKLFKDNDITEQVIKETVKELREKYKLQ